MRYAGHGTGAWLYKWKGSGIARKGKWVMSFAMDVPEEKPELSGFVGIDLGVKKLATISRNSEKATIANISSASQSGCGEVGTEID